jgi:galactonate dehydratase
VKIVAVRPLVLGTPWRNLTFVVVATDEGLEGVGEVRMVGNTDALLETVHALRASRVDRR